MAWLDAPNLRLGQLITNATYPDAFYFEDEVFVESVEDFVANWLVR